MSTVLKIPILDTFFDELEDAFIDEKVDAHTFIWEQLRALCRDAKLGKLSKSCVVNIIKNKQQVRETVKLRGLELKELPSNPNWIPKTLEKDDLRYFEHKVTDKTLEYLNLFASFTYLRHEKYGESLAEENKISLQNLKDKKASQEMIDDAEKGFEETLANYTEGSPKCLEEVLYSALYQPINQKVIENVDKAFDKENEELYPKKDAKKA